MMRQRDLAFRIGPVLLGVIFALAGCMPSSSGDDDDDGGAPAASTSGGTGGATFTSSPAISSISPGDGVVGAAITLFGSDFSPNVSENVITFGTSSLSPSSAVATQLTFLVPPLAPGTYLVSVTTGTLTSNTLPFTILPQGSLSTAGSILLNSTLTVSVVDEITQLALPGTLVQVNSTSGMTTALTNGSGTASFSGMTGPLTLTAGISGYALLSMAGVDASQVTMALEPLATNHIVSGSIVLPDGVPTFKPDGTSASNGLQWSAFVTADHEPRFSPLRGAQTPFPAPNTGGNSGAGGQTLDFSLVVYEGQPFRLVRGLAGNFANAPLIEIATYEVATSTHNGITSDLNLGSLSFQTTASNNGANVLWLLLSNNDAGSITGLPSGSLGNESITTLMRGKYSGAPTTPSMGLWVFLPFSSAGNLVDSYYYSDPSADSLQVVTGVLGNNGFPEAYYSGSASFDVQDHSMTNPSLPQNVVLPPVPTVSSPTAGVSGIGLTPTFGWNDSLGGTNGFYELTLDQLDGGSVRGWRIIASPSTTSLTLPSLASGFANLQFQQGTNFDSQNQIRFVLSAVRMGSSFDFNGADFGVAFDSDHQVGRVSLGYAP